MEWIDATKRQPDKSGRYLVYAKSMDTDKPFYAVAFYDLVSLSWVGIPTIWANAISHWMLIVPPKDK